MKLFTCTEFTGHCPVGTSAVITALTIDDAIALLTDKLADVGLKQPVTETMLKEVRMDVQQAIILQNGDY